MKKLWIILMLVALTNFLLAEGGQSQLPLRDTVIDSFPYYENFDGAWTGSPAAPAGWKVIDNDNDGSVWRQDTAGLNGPQSAPYAAVANGCSNDYLISPRIDLSQSYVKLKWYDVVNSFYSPNSYQVLLSTTDDQIDSFVHVLDYYDCMNEEWLEHTIDLRQYHGEENVYIAFYHFGSVYDHYPFGIDNVSLEPISEQPILMSQPDYLDFGTVVFGSTVPWQYLQLYNDGLGLLTINPGDIWFESGLDYFEVDSSVFPIQIGSAESFDLPIRIRTDSSGYKAETMFLNSAGGEITVSLSGEVLAPGVVIVDVGTIGHGINARYPLGNYFGYERSAALYTSEELGQMNVGLESVAWYANENETHSVPTRIFLKGVWDDELDGNQDWDSFIRGATPVFDQTVPAILAGQWNTFVFDQPFDLEDNMHLLILVERNYGGSGSGSSGGASISQNYAVQKHLLWLGDGVAPAGSGSFHNSRPCIRMTGMLQSASRIPNPAVVISPLPGAEYVNTSATLNWQSGGGQPSGYKLYFSGNPATVDTLDLGNVTSWNTPVLDANTTYYWQIVPYNELGDAVLCPIWSFTTAPEGTIVVGNGDEELYLPFDTYNDYSYSQTIYRVSDISAGPGNIQSLGYYWRGFADAPNSKDWKIYMAHTTKSEFSMSGPDHKAQDDSGWLMPHQLTMVYDGEVNLTDTEAWLNIPLQLPFHYNGVDNLVIGVLENTPGYDDGGGFFLGSVVTWPSSMKSSSFSPIDISNPMYSETSSECPNIKLEMGPLGTEPILYVSLGMMDFGVGQTGVPGVWQNLIVRNAGAGFLQLDSSHFSLTDGSSQYFELDASVFPISLAADETAHLPLRFNANYGNGAINGGLNASFGGRNYLVELRGYAMPLGAVIFGVSQDLDRYPFGTYYGYERTVSLYRADQINVTGTISKISWQSEDHFTGVDIPYKIYMGNSTAMQLNPGTYQDQISTLSLVKEGTLSEMQAGWVDFPLDLPFGHNGDNLIIAVETNYGGSGSMNYTSIYQTYGGSNTNMVYQADHTPPTFSGSMSGYVPNVMLQFLVDSEPGRIAVEPDSLYFAGESSDAYQGMVKVKNIGAGDLTIEVDNSALPSYFQVSPLYAVLSPQDSVHVVITALYENLEPGHYEESLHILCNDPTTSDVPVELVYDVVASAVNVDFEAVPLIGSPGLLVQFTDLSEISPLFPQLSILSWAWDFGDGDTSDEQNPSHTYTFPAGFDVSLKLMASNLKEYELTKTIYITTENADPIVHTPLNAVNMISGVTWGPYDLYDIFSDPDNDPLEFHGRSSSNIAVNIYQDSFTLECSLGWWGTEYIMLFATDPHGASASHTLTVNVAEPNLPPVLSVPAVLHFIRNSVFTVDFGQWIEDIDTPLDDLALELIPTGGNEAIHYEYLPVNVPLTPGQFELKFYSDLQLASVRYFTLRVYDGITGLYSEADFALHLLDSFSPLPELAQSYQYTGESLQFIDATLGNPNYWFWDFGDGNSSDLQNPVHQYVLAGSYTVTFTVGHAEAGEEASIVMPAITMQGTAVFEDEPLPEVFSIDGSPYNLVNGLVIPPDGELEIEDDVEIVLLNEEPIQIQGTLNAHGVDFIPETNSGFWGGLQFSAPTGRNQSSLTQCRIFNALTALEINGGSPSFEELEILLQDGESLDTAAIIIGGESAPRLEDIQIQDYATAIHVESQGATRASTPTLTNIRIRNSTNANRNQRTGLKVVGDTNLNIIGFDAEELETGIVMENATTTTPTLTNIRIRNSTNANRNGTRGIALNNVNSVVLDDVELDDFDTGISIQQEASHASTPTLTNIRIRNSTNANRNEQYALQLLGNVEAQITDLEIEDYAHGIRYIGSENSQRALGTPTLTNIRIRNSTNANRQQGIGAYFAKLPLLELNDVEIDEYFTGLWIEGLEERAVSATPTLSNIRIRNSTNSVRQSHNKGIVLGDGIAGKILDSNIEGLYIGMEIGEQNKTALSGNSFVNCHTGIKLSASVPAATISRQLFWLEADYLAARPGESFQAIYVEGTGGIKVLNNTMVGYPVAVEQSYSDVDYINNIFWAQTPSPEPFVQNGGNLNVQYNDIYYSGGVYPGLANLNVDPLFMDAAQVDFGLHYNSPLIDAGSPQYLDADGTISDIGAFPYLHKVGFDTNYRFITVGTEVIFDSYNLGHDIPGVSTLQWDIGNDGSIESTQPQFNWVFNETGTYDVSIKYSTGNLTDEILYENYIVVSTQQLLPPEGLQISRRDADIQLVWQPVSFTTDDLPVEVEAYLIYTSDQPNGIFKYLDYSTDSSYTHLAGTQNPLNFYFVIAYLGSRAELMDFIRQNDYLDARGNRIDTLKKN